MSALQIVRLGHPALRKKSKPVSQYELKSKKFQKFLKDLTETCVKNNGAGIAAPQVGVNKRVIVVHVSPNNPRYPKRKIFPLTVVINPKVTLRSRRINEDWEGDLSANIRGLVPRHSKCTVTGLLPDGKTVTYHLTNEFHARVFQHEIDHLDGIFLIERIKRKETLSETEEWEKHWKHKKFN